MKNFEVKELLLAEYDKIVVKESNKFCGKGASIVRTAFEAGFERAFKLAINMFNDRMVLNVPSEAEVAITPTLDAPKAVVKKGKAKS